MTSGRMPPKNSFKPKPRRGLPLASSNSDQPDCHLMKSLILALLLVPITSTAGLPPKKKGYVPDETPIGYQSAEVAVSEVPKRPDIRECSQLAPSMISCATDAKAATNWWIFQRGHEFHPSVVRRRIEISDNQHIVKTAVLCGSSTATCGRLNLILRAMDESS